MIREQMVFNGSFVYVPGIMQNLIFILLRHAWFFIGENNIVSSTSANQFPFSKEMLGASHQFLPKWPDFFL